MQNSTKNLKMEVIELIKQKQIADFATCDGERPYVRPITIVYHKKCFWFATFTNSAKVKQIRRSPKCEICFWIGEGASKGYIRAFCVAKIINNKKLKKEIADQMSYFSNWWKDAEDLNYTLVELLIDEIDYMKELLGLKKLKL